MDKKLASESMGKIAEMFAGHNGNYIGEIVKILPGACNIAEVKILACIKYPGQRAIFYNFNNFERWPFYNKTLETCRIDSIELYYGAIPEYYELMPKVLEETFSIETEADREIFERHKKYWDKMRGGISAT
ncbi:hypothetical protein [Ruminiclostridium papyrosolvens]|uniref:Uncharacterized protein n=1 Tax=Ruminiclostridium papyrosolvens C7 TaxID=1330534 RepID=U4QYU8_9FIRM|nr:hypothetical protein [Ruminiclostridium papyrosolvens]EPR10125.1 hypothetical protein L323_14900 [Ruminiclostridium papyrosolvens C7]